MTRFSLFTFHNGCFSIWRLVNYTQTSPLFRPKKESKPFRHRVFFPVELFPSTVFSDTWRFCLALWKRSHSLHLFCNSWRQVLRAHAAVSSWCSLQVSGSTVTTLRWRFAVWKKCATLRPTFSSTPRGLPRYLAVMSNPLGTPPPPNWRKLKGYIFFKSKLYTSHLAMVSVNAAELSVKSQGWNVSVMANNGYMDETPARKMKKRNCSDFIFIFFNLKGKFGRGLIRKTFFFSFFLNWSGAGHRCSI